MRSTGGAQNEHSLDGWLNADLFVTGLKAASPDFTRQKLVDAINKMTDYTANSLLPGVDWTEPGKPFVCLPETLTKIPTNPEVKG